MPASAPATSPVAPRSVKDLRVEPIAAVAANAFIIRHHYSRKVVRNSQLHLGVFLDGHLSGVMQFGPSLDKHKTRLIVRDTPWHNFIELNRLAFSDRLPRNSESRALSVALRMIRKSYPWIQWVISFADATQCGDGTIYRACGFVLTDIKKNDQIWQSATSDDRVIRSTVTQHGRVVKGTTGTRGGASMQGYRDAGYRPLPGYQLRYVYFLDPSARARLTVPEMPYAAIEAAGAGMYRGAARVKQAMIGHPPVSGGAAPTHTLRIAVISLRGGLHSPRPVSCIQDAFFAALRHWFAAQHITPLFWNVSWSYARPQRDDRVLKAADWLIVMSSNEFAYHSKGAVNPLAVTSSNERIVRIKPLLHGKHMVLLTMDAADTEDLILGQTLAGVRPASFDVISECDFPLSIQSLRYGQLRAAIENLPQAARDLDFAYWGTTKRQLPGGQASGDHRYASLNRIFSDAQIRSVQFGHRFGKTSPRKWNTNMSELAPELMRARATWCFNWPGSTQLLTARYHEALALGLIPFVHAGYDMAGQAGELPWQREGNADRMRDHIRTLRDASCYRDRLGEVMHAYTQVAPSDDDQYRAFAAKLAAIGLAPVESAMAA